MSKEETSKVSILHLSDIHFRSEEKAGSVYFRQDVQEKMVATIKEHVEKHKIPNFVSITGDISFDGKDYEKAKEFFGELKQILPGTIFLPVPGNHDVDRDEVDEYFSLYNIVSGGKTDGFLEKEKQVRKYILPKFENFLAFADWIHPGLYDKVKTDKDKKIDKKDVEKEYSYFWQIKNKDRTISFLGLNSAWASESDNDRNNITLGYPQFMEALRRSKDIPYRILLMHHPVFNWLNEDDFSEYDTEIFKNCNLILHGHTHKDRAVLYRDPSTGCIFLGANASYTRDKNRYIGFQFLDVDIEDDKTKLRVWPYIYEGRSKEFMEDRARWGKAQKGKEYYDIPSTNEDVPPPGKPVKLNIPGGYKKWVKSFYSIFDFKHLGEKKNPVDIEISKAYIRIETTNPFYKGDEEKQLHKKELPVKRGIEKPGEPGQEGEPAAIDIEELLTRVPCIVLRGQAGMGKSTLVKHLAYTITQGICKTLLSGYLPVLVFLKDLAGILKESIKNSDDIITFESLLESYLIKRKINLDWQVVAGYISANRALFLLDGLDEVSEKDNTRSELVKIIASFYLENQDNRFLLTGRPHGIAGDAEKKFKGHIFDIQDLNEEMIFKFITDWFREVSAQAEGKAADLSKKMIVDIRTNNNVFELITNPLLLTAVCILYKDGEAIPEQRADLYNRVVERLLAGRFSGAKAVIKIPPAREYLMNLAFSMQEQEVKEIEPGEAVEKLRKIVKQEEGESNTSYKDRLTAIFNIIEPDCGLLRRGSDNRISFTHLTFQEFLAGKHILNEDLGYESFIKKPWWKETLLLYLGYLNIEHKTKSHRIIKSIFEAAGRDKDKSEITYLWLLACRALSEFQESNRLEDVVNLARGKLYSLIESGADIKIRFEAGEIVGKLGDSRIRRDNMIKVEAGEFIRGSEDIDDEEKPVRKIYLDAYMIGKYPVTNEEYMKFVDDDGYKNKEFWTEDGWQWRKKERVVEPVYRHDRKWNGNNFPVVGVSWYEATAYAKWLSKKTNIGYRLPTEAEWEKAARGTDGRVYAWGNKFDKNKCNSFESGLRRTSPVGIFSEGKSPYGCVDITGNVWEWCADWFDEKYYAKRPKKNPKGPDSGSSRVIRGGSWFNDADFVRCAFRLRFVPSARDDFLGFRLCQDIK